jgi:hypothetical protein
MSNQANQFHYHDGVYYYYDDNVAWHHKLSEIQQEPAGGYSFPPSLSHAMSDRTGSLRAGAMLSTRRHPPLPLSPVPVNTSASFQHVVQD